MLIRICYNFIDKNQIFNVGNPEIVVNQEFKMDFFQVLHRRRLAHLHFHGAVRLEPRVCRHVGSQRQEAVRRDGEPGTSLDMALKSEMCKRFRDQ